METTKTTPKKKVAKKKVIIVKPTIESLLAQISADIRQQTATNQSYLMKSLTTSELNAKFHRDYLLRAEARNYSLRQVEEKIKALPWYKRLLNLF